jgi:capsular exopolysaccharide synthesis family protein
MKSEQDVQALPLSKNGKQSEQLALVDIDEFDDIKKRGLNLRPLWRTTQRNALLITGVTTVAAVATFLYSGLTSPHVYEGDFRLLVEPITSEAKFTDPSVLSRDRGASTTNEVDYPTLLQVLKSPGLLSGIAKRIQTRYRDVSYDSLSKGLVVQRIGTNLLDTTKLIEVSYMGKDPKKVQFVLEEVAKGYLNYSLEDRKTHIGQGVKFIQDQLPSWQQQVNSLERELQAFQERYNLSDPTSESAELANQTRQIEAQKLQTQRELREQKTLYINLQRQIGLPPNEMIAASTLSQNPNYQQLLGELKKIESQIAVESARFTSASPVVQTLREKQKNLSLLLNQEAQRIVGSTAKNPQVLPFQNSTRLALIKQLIDTANQVQVLEVRNQAIAQAEAYLKQQERQLPAIRRQYNDLQRRLEIATKTLNQLLVQRETLRVDAAQKEVPWQVVSEPEIQHDAAGNPIPAPRNTTKNLAMGVIAGLVLGLGAAVMRERYRNIFYTTEDIQEAIKLPLLGEIPFDASAKQLLNSVAVVGSIEGNGANHNEASVFLESFNFLYSGVCFLASVRPVHSLVVGSAAPGDGKTTIALHLAQAAAGMGQRVLLVDANLRRPQLHARLGLPNHQGLSNLLSQNLEPKDFIQRTPLEDNLFVLTSGPLLPGATRLLASPHMQHLMSEFQAAFDLVIYDTPHLFQLADANFLATHTDGILMVVGVGKTERSLVMQVLNGLNTARLPILGIVANHVEKNFNSSSSYHKHYYEQKQRVRFIFENNQKSSKQI